MMRWICLIILALMVPSVASAAVKTFTPTVYDGNVSGFPWENANNWTPAGVPFPGDSVVIPATNTANIVVTTAKTHTGSITLNGSGLLLIMAPFTNAGTMTVGTGSTVMVGDGYNGTSFSNTGTLKLVGSTHVFVYGSPFNNSGMISVARGTLQTIQLNELSNPATGNQINGTVASFTNTGTIKVLGELGVDSNVMSGHHPSVIDLSQGTIDVGTTGIFSAGGAANFRIGTGTALLGGVTGTIAIGGFGGFGGASVTLVSDFTVPDTVGFSLSTPLNGCAAPPPLSINGPGRLINTSTLAGSGGLGFGYSGVIMNTTFINRGDLDLTLPKGGVTFNAPFINDVAGTLQVSKTTAACTPSDGELFMHSGMSNAGKINLSGGAAIHALGSTFTNTGQVSGIGEITGSFINKGTVAMGVVFNPVGGVANSTASLSGVGAGSFVATMKYSAAANKLTAVVKDPITGARRGLVRFSPSYGVVQMKSLADINGNGSGELASLGVHKRTGRVLLQIRDPLPGAWIKGIPFPKAYAPQSLIQIPDMTGDGINEVAVLGVHANGQILVQIRNPKTRARIRNVFFGKAFRAIDAASVGDINGNGMPEIAVLLRHKTRNFAVVQLRDASTGKVVKNIRFGNLRLGRKLRIVPDLNGNGFPEVAIMGTRADGKSLVQIRDASTGTVIKNFLLPWAYDIKDIAVLPDANGNGLSEISVLGVRKATGNVVVITKDAFTGILVSAIGYNKNFAPQKIMVGADMNANGTPEIGVLGTNVANGRSLIQYKDSVTKRQISVVTL